MTTKDLIKIVFIALCFIVALSLIIIIGIKIAL